MVSHQAASNSCASCKPAWVGPSLQLANSNAKAMSRKRERFISIIYLENLENLENLEHLENLEYLLITKDFLSQLRVDTAQRVNERLLKVMSGIFLAHEDVLIVGGTGIKDGSL